MERIEWWFYSCRNCGYREPSKGFFLRKFERDSENHLSKNECPHCGSTNIDMEINEYHVDLSPHTSHNDFSLKDKSNDYDRFINQDNPIIVSILLFASAVFWYVVFLSVF